MDLKTRATIAATVALLGVGVAVYLAYSSLGGGRAVRSASEASAAQSAEAQGGGGGEDLGLGAENGTSRTVEIDGPPPEWMQQNLERSRAYADEFEFPDADETMPSFDDGSVDLALRAESDDALGTLGLASRRGLIETWAAFMQPLVAGDRAGFERAIADMGAPNPEGGATLFDRLSGFLEGARLSMGSTRLRSVDPNQPGSMPRGMPDIPGMPEGATAIPMMIGVMELSDDATGETTTIREMNVPLDAIFPNAAEASRGGARTVEVWSPAKLKSARGERADIGPSVYFAYDDQSNAWQPVAMRLALVSDAATSKLESVMRNSRRGPQD